MEKPSRIIYKIDIIIQVLFFIIIARSYLFNFINESSRVTPLFLHYLLLIFQSTSFSFHDINREEKGVYYISILITFFSILFLGAFFVIFWGVINFIIVGKSALLLGIINTFLSLIYFSKIYNKYKKTPLIIQQNSDEKILDDFML